MSPARGRRGLRRGVLVGCAAGALALAAVFGKGGAFDAARYREERDRLGEEIARLENETERLQAEVAALATDDFELERIAREELNLARPGEIVLLLPRADR